MQSEKHSGSHEDQLELLNSSSDHLLDFINDVVDLKVLKDKGRTLEEEQINLKKITNGIIDSLLETENKNTNAIHRNIDEKIPNVLMGDTLSISQILNLWLEMVST